MANAPLPLAEPSPQLAFLHSWVLLRSVPAEVWEERRRCMNPVRFEWV